MDFGDDCRGALAGAVAREEGPSGRESGLRVQARKDHGKGTPPAQHGSSKEMGL